LAFFLTKKKGDARHLPLASYLKVWRLELDTPKVSHLVDVILNQLLICFFKIGVTSKAVQLACALDKAQTVVCPHDGSDGFAVVVIDAAVSNLHFLLFLL
jgi:hypothetical protein